MNLMEAEALMFQRDLAVKTAGTVSVESAKLKLVRPLVSVSESYIFLEWRESGANGNCKQSTA